MPVFIKYEFDGIKNHFVINHDKVVLRRVELSCGETEYYLMLLIPDMEEVDITAEEYSEIEMQLDTISVLSTTPYNTKYRN